MTEFVHNLNVKFILRIYILVDISNTFSTRLLVKNEHTLLN